VVQLALDSLRHWHGALGVDGFRFDLAPVLGRSGPGGAFDARAPFFAALAQDPQLGQALCIAEPWDIGPGGHCLGAFPPGWLEWNDRYRDTQRRFWLLRQGSRGAFAHRFMASSTEFDHGRRAPTASVNFVTAHDGFTLRDLVSYERRHNAANGEDNRDGHAHNLSVHCGVEGDSDDPQVLACRRRLRRALLAALMLSQGTPMLLAGDELGHTQRGNNNAYCQDNATTWLDWAAADPGLAAYVARLAALRREAAPLRRAHWWPADDPALRWLAPEGHAMAPADWEREDRQALAVLFDDAPRTRWLLLVNAGAAPASFALPPGGWTLALDSSADDAAPGRALDGRETIPASSLWLARQPP